MSNKVSIGFTGDFSFSGHFVGCHTKEDLIAAVQRLRMENEYLKKLRALVQERIDRENGNVPPSSTN